MRVSQDTDKLRLYGLKFELEFLASYVVAVTVASVSHSRSNLHISGAYCCFCMRFLLMHLFFFFNMLVFMSYFFFFFLNDPAPPEISPLPHHAPLPIFHPPPPHRFPKKLPPDPRHWIGRSSQRDPQSANRKFFPPRGTFQIVDPTSRARPWFSVSH